MGQNKVRDTIIPARLQKVLVVKKVKQSHYRPG